jgi:hypothetical protein
MNSDQPPESNCTETEAAERLANEPVGGEQSKETESQSASDVTEL